MREAVISSVETNGATEGLALGFVRCKGEARANGELRSGKARDGKVVVAWSTGHSRKAESVAFV